MNPRALIAEDEPLLAQMPQVVLRVAVAARRVRLVAADADFQDLEVHSAGLAEAFIEITQEAA